MKFWMERVVTVSGDIRPSNISVKKNYLPLGLTAGVKMLRDVKANSIFEL